MLLVVLAGCYAPQPVPGAPCSADGKCPAGLVCITDRCVLPGAVDDASDARDDAPVDTTSDTMLMTDAMVDAPPGGPPPELLQQAFQFATPGTSVTATFQNSPLAGHILVAVAGCSTNSLDAITGGATSWLRAAFSTANANVEVFVGVANGEKAVTVTLPTCATQMSLSISEWEHVSLPVETVAANAGLASPATANSITTSGAPRLLLFSVANFTPNTFGTPSQGPWNELTPIVGQVELRTWYRVVTASATFAPTVSETRHNWDATLVSIKGM